jgi:hypothetical protein
MSGSTARQIRASLTWRTRRIRTMPASIAMSLMIVTSATPNISSSAWTSFVVRVTSRPTGFRWKYAMLSPWMWRKSSTRMS